MEFKKRRRSKNIEDIRDPKEAAKRTIRKTKDPDYKMANVVRAVQDVHETRASQELRHTPQTNAKEVLREMNDPQYRDLREHYDRGNVIHTKAAQDIRDSYHKSRTASKGRYSK